MVNLEELEEQMADSVRGIEVKVNLYDPVLAQLDSNVTVVGEFESWYRKGLTRHEQLAHDLDLPLDLAKWYALIY